MDNIRDGFEMSDYVFDEFLRLVSGRMSCGDFFANKLVTTSELLLQAELITLQPVGSDVVIKSEDFKRELESNYNYLVEKLQRTKYFRFFSLDDEITQFLVMELTKQFNKRNGM